MFSVFFYICLVEVEADFANETSTSSILLSTINSTATNLDSTTSTTTKYSLNNSNSEFFDHLLNSTQYNKRENPEFNTSKTVVVSIDDFLGQINPFFFIRSRAAFTSTFLVTLTLLTWFMMCTSSWDKDGEMQDYHSNNKIIIKSLK